MVKLASAREIRTYGPRVSRSRSEYMNAGLYVFSTILLVGGFVAQYSSEPRSGLVLLLLGYLGIVIVNVHDLFAHLAGFDYRLSLMEYDLQLALVEITVPLTFILGTLLQFVATLILFIQAEKGYGYFQLEEHALNMFCIGSLLWIVGSFHNSCQVYERADAFVQILQQAVLIPFLMASLLFFVAAFINNQEHNGAIHHGLELLGETCIWLCMIGSFILFLGGSVNVVKVYQMQQPNEVRLEKLRGGAEEMLIEIREGEGHVPLIAEDSRRRRPVHVEDSGKGTPADVQKKDQPTPYKDVLVSRK